MTFHGENYLLFQVQRGRFQQQNVVNVRPGSTAFATNRVIEDRQSSSFRIILSEAMLQNIQKCTIYETQRVTGDVNWNVTLHELDKFIGLIITRCVRAKGPALLWPVEYVLGVPNVQ